jgi:hypothetical protein
MSSPGSDVLTIELPARLASDRALAGLIVAAAVGVEVVMARYPDGQAGLGLATGVLLALWQFWLDRRAAVVRTAALDRRGEWRLVRADGRRVAAVLLPGTRVLGPTVVLRLKGGRLTRCAWLTPWDLPAVELRRLTVRLMAADR